MLNTTTPAVFYHTLDVEGQSFPARNSIYWTRAISRWKRKSTGLAR
jgi:hypothetical protein